MDEDQISLRIKKCRHLKFRSQGVYAADNYPLDLPVNTSRSNSIGAHWVVLVKRYAYPLFFFVDPLALPKTILSIFSPSYKCTETWK